jgi:hypothetical protein
MSDMYEEIVEKQDSATNLVTDKFNEAKDYADQSWDLFNDAVDELKTKIDNFDGETIDIAEPSVSTDDITSDVDTDSKGIEFRDIMSKLTELNGLPSVPSAPVLDPLQDFPVVRTNLADQLMDNYVTKMLAKLAEGGTGLGADTEAAIWQRALDRQELEVQKMYEEAESFFAARGFSMPPGMLAGRISEINIEVGRKRDAIDMDIAIKQAELAQTNEHYILTEVQKFALQETLQEIQMIAAVNDTRIRKYAAQVQAFGTVLNGIISAVDEGVKLLGAYIEKYKSTIQLVSVQIDALYKSATVTLEVAKLKLTQAMKMAELQVQEDVAVYNAKVECAKALASVSGQGMAAALTSIHASASLGVSDNLGYSGSYSRGDSYDMTKETASGPTRSEVHQYIHK